MASVDVPPESEVSSTEIDMATLYFIKKEYPKDYPNVRSSWVKYSELVRRENKIK